MEIGRKKILRQYYSILYRLTGVNIDFVSEDGEILKLCEYERFNEFCKLVRSTGKGREACDACGHEALRQARATGKNVLYDCHAGLVDIGIPLFVNKRFIGCLASGQILRERPTEESFAASLQRLAALGLDEGKLREAYFATPVFEKDKLDALVELVALVGNYIVESESKLLFLEEFNERDKITVVRQYIEKHYKKKLPVSEVAGLVCLSPSHFSHLFKEEVGISFVNYLNRYRVEKAKELLSDSELSVTEIANEVGFQSLPHFNRTFRKLEPRPPQAYRKSS